jgi:O-methyltransferase involved in polyketide biosynthesis
MLADLQQRGIQGGNLPWVMNGLHQYLTSHEQERLLHGTDAPIHAGESEIEDNHPVRQLLELVGAIARENTQANATAQMVRNRLAGLQMEPDPHAAAANLAAAYAHN